MNEVITSIHNPKIKTLRSLKKPRERKKTGWFVIEGVKELSMAMHSGYIIEQVFYCRNLIDITTLDMTGMQKTQLTEVSLSVFNKVVYRQDTGGVVAIARQKSHSLNKLSPGKCPLILILEAVEKPGNLGAILRTADAAAIDAVIVCDMETDLYNPNVVRSGLGALFTCQVGVCTSEEAIAWLKEKGIALYSAHLEASAAYDQVDYCAPCAIALGTEATGLSQQWVQHATRTIIIPMGGEMDSLNVSNTAAILAFEARRQRGF